MSTTQVAPNLYDLGQWKPDIAKLIPSRYMSIIVHDRFKAIPAVQGKLIYPTLRGPGYRAENNTCAWHRDFGSKNVFILVWATIYPTEIEPAPIKLKPWHIYAIHNLTYLHRTPAETNGSGRWFARAYVSEEDFRGVEK